MSTLEAILASTRERVAVSKRAVPAAQLERAAAQRAASGQTWPTFEAALARPGLSLIAEHKRRSPSAGVIRDGAELEGVVAAYERGGAAAISVLTEGPSFGGSLDDLRAARAAVRLPILRKDFIVDSYQLLESAAAGADAVLLIVAALIEPELRSLHSEALARGLTPLAEVHDERELERAQALDARVIGINNRDLTTLAVDRRRVFSLLPRVGTGTLVVAESGFSSRDELDGLARAGVSAVLVGEALMRAPDIEAACRVLTAPLE